jgi:hypothetical protein
MDTRQGALAGLADAPRRPACINDQRVNHGFFLRSIDWEYLLPINI